jgi:hypothetical protein
MREGFDPFVAGQPLHFRSPKSGEYRSLDAAAFAEIADGTIRFQNFAKDFGTVRIFTVRLARCLPRNPKGVVSPELVHVSTLSY